MTLALPSAPIRFALALILLAAGASLAQTEDLATTARRDVPPPDQLAADSLARLAMTNLRDIADPSRGDYRLTALALRVARRTYPDDTELLRLEIDAWDAADEDARAIAATRQLVTLDPDDHVAWLRLLNQNIKQIQSADERLVAYDRLLGPGGRRLDAAVRSRLALDAALLARETGDDELFVQRLTEATSLDVTNKNAAALYATYFSERTNDPLIRLELMGNVLLADPLDPALLTNLASELFRQRAFLGAQRFFARAGDVLVGSQVPLVSEDLFDRILITWMVDGERDALDAITELRNQQQSFLNAQRRRMVALDLDPGAEREAQVPPIIEMIRLAIGFGIQGSPLGEEPLYPDSLETPARNTRAHLTFNDLAGDSLRRARQVTDIELELLEARKPPYDQMSDTEVADLVVMTKLQLILVRLWAGDQIDEAEADLDALTDAPDQSMLSPEAIQRFRGLIAVRRGQALVGAEQGRSNPHLERARTLLEPLVQNDRVARLGLGILEEVEGRPQAAIRQYAQIAVSHANTAIGCSARRRIETLLAAQLPQDQAAAALDQWAQSFAPWLDRLTTGPRRYMTLSAKHTAPSASPLERMTVRITLRNVSSRPLAIGHGATIDSQMLLTPRVTIPGRSRSELELPEVVEFTQRLRLMPGETITTDVWSNRGTVGTLLELNAHSSASLRWRVLQGYRIDDQGHFTHGTMSLTTETDLIERYALPRQHDAGRLADHIRSAQGDDLAKDLLLASIMGATSNPGLTDQEDLERLNTLIATIIDRAPHISGDLRAYFFALVSQSSMFDEGGSLREFAQNEVHPVAQAVLLNGPFRRDPGPLVQRLANSDDPDIRDMAREVIESAPAANSE